MEYPLPLTLGQIETHFQSGNGKAASWWTVSRTLNKERLVCRLREGSKLMILENTLLSAIQDGLLLILESELITVRVRRGMKIVLFGARERVTFLYLES